MNGNTLLSEEQAFGFSPLLKVTALLYLKEALAAQEFESCQEIVGTAKGLGVEGADISAVIADYLKHDTPAKPKTNRLR